MSTGPTHASVSPDLSEILARTPVGTQGIELVVKYVPGLVQSQLGLRVSHDVVRSGFIECSNCGERVCLQMRKPEAEPDSDEHANSFDRSSVQYRVLVAKVSNQCLSHFIPTRSSLLMMLGKPVMLYCRPTVPERANSDADYRPNMRGPSNLNMRMEITECGYCW